MRTVILWVPDWPIIALSREVDDPAAPLAMPVPVAVVQSGAITACSAPARASGVRRGQRRRDAQARCPELLLVEADTVRDHRVFSPLVAGLEERAPGVQVIRPGLCALRIRGPARYYGGEREAASVLRESFVAAGVSDVRAGIADGPFTAEQATRATTAHHPVRVVPAGEAAAFLAPLPVSVLDGMVDGNATGVVDLLTRLGVRTLGEVAALHPDRLVERFGRSGARLHALAAGQDSQPVQPRTPPPELARDVDFEPPLELAEQVGFAMRVAADEFIAQLGARELVCTELRVVLTGDRGELSERVWLHPGSFDASAVVDRIRWQLAEAEGFHSAVARVHIAPEAVAEASAHTVTLFGSGAEERVHHALSRVQAMLGHREVVTPMLAGGRWLTERQVMVPWGDRLSGAPVRERPWPGSLPDPLPSTVFDERPDVQVFDAHGAPVTITARGEVSAAPAMFTPSRRAREIVQWAGPWPVIEHGWDAARARRAHRFQVVDVTQVAWLLLCENDVWSAEGRYD